MSPARPTRPRGARRTGPRAEAPAPAGAAGERGGDRDGDGGARPLPADRPHAERVEALRLLSGVLDRARPLSELTAEAPELSPAQRARALSRAGETLRRLGQADATLKRFLRRAPPPAARHALRLAAVEILHLGEAPHAAADGAVAAVRSLSGGERLTGLVNAVARRLAAEGEAPWAAQDAARANMPGWLWGRLSSAYGAGTARRIAAAHLETPPADLTPRDPADAPALAERLGAEIAPGGGLRLRERPQVSALPGYAEGEWWVQDAAAAQPARLLGKVAGRRVLDLCAAPGGKTLQLAAAGARVTALDISEPRLLRLRENLARTGLSAETVAADALDWTPEGAFDAILLDAPCSATGTARRHPDMPHLRESLDLKRLCALQDDLLDRAWDWLAPGGRLVFATCSLLPEEGEARAAAFAARRPEARRVPARAEALSLPAEAVDSEGNLRTRPDFSPESGGMDGFFAASFAKGA